MALAGAAAPAAETFACEGMRGVKGVGRRWWLWLLPVLLLAACQARPGAPAAAPPTPPATGAAPVTGAAQKSPFHRQAVDGALPGPEAARVWSSGGRWLWLATGRTLFELDFAADHPALRQVWTAPGNSNVTALALAGPERVLVQLQASVGYDLQIVTPATGAATALSSSGKAGSALVSTVAGSRAAFVEEGSAGIVVADLPSGKRRVIGEAGAVPFAFTPSGNHLVYWMPRNLAGEQPGAQDNPGYLVLADLNRGQAANFSDWYVSLRDRGWDGTGTYYMAEVRRHATSPTLTAVWHRQQGLVVELPGTWRWAEQTPLTLISTRDAVGVTLPDTQPHPVKAQVINSAGTSPDGKWWYDPILLRERHQLLVLDAVTGNPLLQDSGWVRADWSPGSDRLVVTGDLGQWADFYLAGP